MAERVLFSIAEEIVKKLGPLATQEIALWWGVKDQLRKLKSTVTRIMAVVHDAEEQAEPDNQLADWLGKLQEAVYKAEDLLDDFSTEVQRRRLISQNKISREVRTFFSGSNQFVYGWQMGHKVKELRERLDNICEECAKFHFEKKASLTVVREQNQTTSSEPEIMIGRDDDKKKVIDFLLSSNDDKESVSVISIVGMGGLGKTTLAQSIFNDDQVNSHFDIKLWASVSGGFDVKKILKDILETAGTSGVFDQLESLKNKLKKKIENRKYLLVLDDVWDNKDGQDSERWDRLKESLLSGARGSKIIVTTRSRKVANLTSTLSHDLKALSESESWDLFKKRAFGQGDQESNHVNNIEEIRREIVDRCCRVPMVIKAISRVMSQKDKAQWLPFIKQELPASVQDDDIIHTLKFSYNSLPSYMKHCFAYCSLFPKGHKIDVKSLIQLWIAQGFVNYSNSGECLEIVALKCFENLLWRSFFHDAEKDDLGNIQSCRMHDFMHDLATKVAGSESTKIERGGNRISDLTRHVSFDKKLDLSQQIPILLPCAKRLRTLMLLGRYSFVWKSRGWIGRIWESICQEFRRLRVLDLNGLGIKEVLPLIEKFKHLRYLDLSDNKMEALPNSITNLVNLQVVKLNGCEKLKELPRDINKLINLRHLDLGCSVDEDLCENLEYMPCGIGQLTCLQTLSCFVIGKNSDQGSKMVGGLDELSWLNELRGRLEIRILGYERNSCIPEFVGAKLMEKQYLQSLVINWGDFLEYDIDLCDRMLESLQPHSNLQELRVAKYGGMRFPSWLSHLTSLETIRLAFCRSCKHIPPLHEISSLEDLSIISMHNLEYIDSEGVGGRGVSTFFPSLKRLQIWYCPSLKGWWKKSSSDEEINDDSDESTTTATADQQQELMTMLSFPRLSSLRIWQCSNLTSMPLFPSLDDKLILETSSSVPLQQTMKMKGWKPTTSSSASSSPSTSSSFICPLSQLKELSIDGLQDMESLPEDGLQNLSSLQQLSIGKCSKLKSLPLPNQGMHSLQRLIIRECKELRTLSESQCQMIPCLPSLQQLEISECSEELSGRLREGKYWPIIKHIPHL